MKNALLLFYVFCLTKQLSAQMPADQTWVIISYIKESAKTDYEKWMTDIFFAPMQSSTDPVLKQQFSTARWQKPVRQNTDKTWTYGILLDPAIPKADYGIEPFLVKTYGDTKGKAYMKQYEGFMASAGQIHFFEMSKGLTTPSVNSEEDIKKFIVDETGYWIDGNFEKWAEGFVHEPYLLWSVTNGGEPGDVLTMRGWESLKTFMGNWFKNYNASFAKKMKQSEVTRDNWQIQIRGNVAYVSYNQHSVNADTKQILDSTETRVLEKINGAWKIAMQTTLADFKDAVPPIKSKY